MRPRSLLRGDLPEDPTLSADESRALAEQVLRVTSAPTVVVRIDSEATGSTTWSRSQVDAGTDTRQTVVSVAVAYGRRAAVATTNRLDDAGLRAAVGRAELLAKAERVLQEEGPDPPTAAGAVNPGLWHENALVNLEPRRRIDLYREARAAIEKSEEGTGLLVAGVVGGSARSSAVLTNAGHFEYGRTSTSTYRVTVRTSDGTGSGWAGWQGEDWAKLDSRAVVERAIDLARRSRRPLAVEPGRYAVVLAPEALGALVAAIAQWGAFDGRAADEGRSPFSGTQPGGAPVFGRKVFDERVTLSSDPMDPDGGFLPFGFVRGGIEQYRPVTWVRNGVLETLEYNGAYARRRHRVPVANPGGLRMAGGPSSIEEMIAATTRGILVTRVSELSLVAFRPFVLTGVTRDGTFLIEHGKIVKPIKNLRFEDSPFVFLNNLEALGPTQRVAVGYGRPYVMPSGFVRDFTFTGLTEAV